MSSNAQKMIALGMPPELAKVVSSAAASEVSATNISAALKKTNLSVPATAKMVLPRIPVQYFGGIGDGNSHPLSEFYANLAAAQAVYPFATSLTQEIDHCAIQLGLRVSHNNHAGEHPVIFLPRGRYLVASLQGYTHAGIEGEGEGVSHSIVAINHGYIAEIMQLAGTVGDVIKFDANSDITGTRPDDGSIADVSIRKISFRGQWTLGSEEAANNVIGCTDGVRFTQGVHIEDLFAHNFGGDVISTDAFPIPAIFKNIWGVSIGGDVISMASTGAPTKAGQLYDFDAIQGDFVVGALCRIDGTGIRDAGGSLAGVSMAFRNFKHEIDSSATSTTAYGPDTIVLSNVDRASVIVENCNPQPSNPLGGGTPVTNSVLKIIGTVGPYYEVIGSRMGSANGLADFLVDDQFRGIQVSKRCRSASFMPDQKMWLGHAVTDLSQRSRVLNDDTKVLDAFDRFSIQTDGKMAFGGGANAADAFFYRSGSRRFQFDDAIQAKRLMARGGPLLVAADFALSAGWGTTATVTVDAANSNTDQRFRVTVNSNGTGQAANPVLTLSFSEDLFGVNQAWVVAPVAVAMMATESTGAIAHVSTGTRTVGTLALTYHDTPVAASTYVFDVVMIG